MKKQTIWILTILMALTFVVLIFMQIFYMRGMMKMRNEQFSMAVKQSLITVSHKLSHEEARYFLDNASQVTSSLSYDQYLDDAAPRKDALQFSITTTTGLEANITITGEPGDITRIQRQNDRIQEHYQNVQDEIRDRYNRQKGVVDEVIVNILSQSAQRPLSERADSAKVAKYLRQELDTMGIHLPFEFAIVNRAGTPLVRTAGYRLSPNDKDNMFIQRLFPHDPADKLMFLKVYFPTKSDYIYSAVSYVLPTIIFTFFLMGIFVYTIIVAFRQKKLTEMKNDFINNMTHEFKTPISSISLAAQMLNDTAVRKSPAMLSQISTVINDETKRLRFQVEKVLQMSMFERQKTTLKIEEVDANVELYNIVNTFKLKVEKYGGKITDRLDALNAIVSVDKMHFTNVIFNLLDNAVKYRSEERSLMLEVTSSNPDDEHLEITVEDNGIGIQRDDLKKIFEKFYRVSTGNRHDVKGFGLGLAYVKKMTTELGGEISVESELNVGTRFKILLPLSSI